LEITPAFGDYARFHPHLHAIVADGLFRKSGSFYVLPRCEMKQLVKIWGDVGNKSNLRALLPYSLALVMPVK
jgi:hypothetical protein